MTILIALAIICIMVLSCCRTADVGDVQMENIDLYDREESE